MEKMFIFLLSGLIVLFSACDEQAGRQQLGLKQKIEDHSLSATWSGQDSLIFAKFIRYVTEEDLQQSPTGDNMIAIGRFFLGTPYVAKTLEKEGQERLIINLREMDCTTFLENVLAFTICIGQNHITQLDFEETLCKLRYRQGIINGYASRLHYFTDWLADNEDKGIITITSNQYGPQSLDTRVDWMSAHPEFYPQLQDKKWLEEIKQQELEISARSFRFVPETQIDAFSSNIQGGDLIAICSRLNGLDIAHVGLAIYVENRLHLLHASSGEGSVVISAEPLQEYLLSNEGTTGIITARLK